MFVVEMFYEGKNGYLTGSGGEGWGFTTELAFARRFDSWERAEAATLWTLAGLDMTVVEIEPPSCGEAHDWETLHVVEVTSKRCTRCLHTKEETREV